MKICIVLGTRPEIIKCAPIIRECQRRDIPFILIHSGQHYSYEMDQIFFEELNLPKPNYALEVGSDTHGRQTARILEGVEEILLEERPNAVLVQGDTNTVIAGALAAAKLHIPVGHVEAGLRSYYRVMPEELNRLVADVLADHLFVPTEKSKKILLGEGVDADRIEVVGNTVVDATLEHIEIARKTSKILEETGLKENEYFLVTSHRPENVDDENRLRSILESLVQVSNKYKYSVVWPIHPRTEKMISEFGHDDILKDIHGLKLIKPVGYFDSLRLQCGAKLILTDSGGIQEEACILGTPCVTLRDNTERPESIDVGANKLAGVGTSEIIHSIEEMIEKDGKWENPFGNGTTAKQIIDILAEHYDQKEDEVESKKN